jgi:hypothetical protein
MRTIITVGKQKTDAETVAAAVKGAGWSVTRVLCGESARFDPAVGPWADQNNIPFERYPANWGTNGLSAGSIRSREMVDNADALIAIWNGKSKATRTLISMATQRGLKVHLVLTDSTE